MAALLRLESFYGIMILVSTLHQIEDAISHLPPAQFRELVGWMTARQQELWDRQMEEDAKAGRLDGLWKAALEEIEAGKTTSLDEFLDHS